MGNVRSKALECVAEFVGVTGMQARCARRRDPARGRVPDCRSLGTGLTGGCASALGLARRQPRRFSSTIEHDQRREIFLPYRPLISIEEKRRRLGFPFPASRVDVDKDAGGLYVSNETAVYSFVCFGLCDNATCWKGAGKRRRSAFGDPFRLSLFGRRTRCRQSRPSRGIPRTRSTQRLQAARRERRPMLPTDMSTR